MKHAYLTKRDIDVARVLRQVTKLEISELMKKMEKCAKSRKIGNIILHDVA